MSVLKTFLAFILLSLGFMSYAQENRTVTGEGNNQIQTDLGATGSALHSYCTNGFSDFIAEPSGVERGNAREISNLLFEQEVSINDYQGLSDFVWGFGQFIDHDITLVHDFSPASHPDEAMFIQVPFNDEYFSPNSFIPMMRSEELEGSGTSIDNPRRYANEITSFVDGSAVYGSDLLTANWLRTFENGKLKVSDGNLLPWNTTTSNFNSPVDNAAPNMDDPLQQSNKIYVAGDVRANENPILASFHTLFVREHNRICDELNEKHPEWNDEQLYQYARKLNGGMIQNILFNEWLPTLGIMLPDYVGYQAQVDPSIYNVFSAAAFRMGHTLINSNLIRMNNEGEELPSGHISLKDAYFNPLAINLAGGVEPYIKGMATQVQQNFDCKIISDLRNFLFGSPQNGGLDLAAININRGRDRGLPDYNTIREDFGLPRVNSFVEICSDPEIVLLLEEIYSNVNNIDPWVGMLAEDHMDGTIFGQLVREILRQQFRNLRDGDRFYFENDEYILEEDLELIRSTRMVDIIKRNTNIDLMQENVFLAMAHQDLEEGPTVDHINLRTTIYPNPVEGNLSFAVWSDFDQEVNIKVLNISGDIVLDRDILCDEGKNLFEIELSSDLLPGIYHMRTTSGRQFHINKLIIR